jgi:hypothetical protein
MTIELPKLRLSKLETDRFKQPFFQIEKPNRIPVCQSTNT